MASYHYEEGMYGRLSFVNNGWHSWAKVKYTVWIVLNHHSKLTLNPNRLFNCCFHTSCIHTVYASASHLEQKWDKKKQTIPKSKHEQIPAFCYSQISSNFMSTWFALAADLLCNWSFSGCLLCLHRLLGLWFTWITWKRCIGTLIVMMMMMMMMMMQFYRSEQAAQTGNQNRFATRINNMSAWNSRQNNQ